MNLSPFFKSIIDSDEAAVVICDTKHTIVYMNPSAVLRYSKKGGAALVGQSIFDCHNEKSREKINKVVSWLLESPSNNRIFTFHSSKENMDVYMIALRDENSELIGYYEKHEYRTPEISKSYSF